MRLGPAASEMTPLAFLDRATRIFAERTAVIDGERGLTYAELDGEVRRLAAALVELGLRPGDRVAVLAPNTALMLAAHYAVPLAGGVLLALNTRLNAGEVQWIVGHAGAALLIHDEALGDLAAGAAVRTVAEPELRALAAGLDPLARTPLDDLGLLALNYTSGTTGRPKGVMYQHRGAYLQAMAMAYHARLRPGSVYLWTLPMFHCNGWCFPWAVTAAGATHVCLPQVDPVAIWQQLERHRVTHFNAAPTVLSMLAWHEQAGAWTPEWPIEVGTGGAPPSPALLERMEELGFVIRHLYGLTETYGPIVVNDWQPEWDELSIAGRARLIARQGNSNILAGQLRLAGAAELGEVQVRGNNVMLGYYEDAAATAEAFTEDGWFRTGDLGVMDDDGYVELRDRAKNVIISGGENIASIEVEHAIASHPAVLEAAVVARPDPHWGEVPVAFVELKPDGKVTDEELIDHVRDRIARFKAPKRVIFGQLPRTATGKVQKFELREST
ncbi:MAG: AMP-binding protein [Actinobacteria bacterium]|nr:AMP-binding protein [Actinomycetota bacterium]